MEPSEPLVNVQAWVCPRCGDFADYVHPVKLVKLSEGWVEDKDRDSRDGRGPWLLRCSRDCGWIGVAPHAVRAPSYV